MLLGITFVASGLLWSTTSATPAQTAHRNSAIPKASVTSPASYNGSSCPVNCTYLPIFRSSQYWSKYISVATVATVIIVVNDSNNTTKTVTNYVESFLINGTAPTNSLPPRTDTNEAGTVTQQLTVLGDSIATFTYPTPYYGVNSAYVFGGILPYSNNGGTTCISNDGLLPLPSHTPWPSPTGTVDPEDRFGLSYMMQDEFNLPGFSKDWVATQFPGQLIDAVFQSCTTPVSLRPATAVSAVSFLTVTSTAHVSDPVPPVPSSDLPAAEPPSLEPPVPPPSPPELPAAEPPSSEPPVPPPSPPELPAAEPPSLEPPVPSDLEADPQEPPNPSTGAAPPPDDALPPPDIPEAEPPVLSVNTSSPSLPPNGTTNSENITSGVNLPVFTGVAHSLRHVVFKALQVGIAFWCICTIHIL